MRLLLTRSAVDAARTRETLEAMGHEVIVSPLIEMVATGAAFPTGVVDVVVATSAQAFAMPLDGFSPEARRLTPLFLVGSRTAEAAKAAGCLGATTLAANAVALADVIGSLAHRTSRLVYLAGRERKPTLETALAEMRQSFEVVEVYDAQAVDELNEAAAEALTGRELDGALHFSRRSVELFIAAAAKANGDIRHVVHFCLSEDVAAPLSDVGCATIKVAEMPRESTMIALIEASL